MAGKIKRIAIVGNAGSGKTTLSTKLAAKLNLALYHLDRYFWKPNWQEPDRSEFIKIHDRLCDKEEWIIEGISTKTASYRFERADMIVFLDVPRMICLWRIFKRMIQNWNKEICAPGCRERGPTRKFLSFVWNFDKNRKPTILDMIRKYKEDKKIYVISNQSDITKLLSSFK